MVAGKKTRKDVLMNQEQHKISNRVVGAFRSGGKLFLLPFRENGFAPLYPVLKSKTLMTGLVTVATVSQTFAAPGSYGIDASSGLGYVQWIIMAIGLIFTLIMGISAGFAFKNDAANAKAQLIGTILIPVLFAIILYIFNQTLGISLNSSSGL